ncbi:MAG: hypothetical protein H0W44_01325 [Gammaproteobacteria bacterium]|nr:hypothetical protein [Gammaproteobacteria bacterium]
MQKIKMICGIVLISLCVINPAVAAVQLTAAKSAKLQKAHEVALRVRDKTGDVSAAISTLQEAGIADVLTVIPPAYEPAAYQKLLHDYAYMLLQRDDRYLEAADLFKRVILLNPEYHTAYLGLGDVYYKAELKKPNPQNRVAYTQAYQQYAALVRKKKIKTVLPLRVAASIYGAAVNDVCDMSKYLIHNNLNYDFENLFDPVLKTEAVPAKSLVGVVKHPMFHNMLEKAQGSIAYSRIDLDNDGSLEEHYASRSSVDNCKRHVFVKIANDVSSVLNNALLDRYMQPGQLCGEADLQLLRFNDRNYLLEKIPDARRSYVIKIYDFKKDGGYQQRCEVAPQTSVELQVSTDCNAAVCNSLLSGIDAAVQKQGQVGDEKEVADAGTLRFAVPQNQMSLYEPYIQSPFLYKADIDNDGKDEIIARLWQETAQGKRYSYRLFKQNPQQLWQPYVFPVIAGDEGIKADEWFFVHSETGQQYIVTYGVFQYPETGQREYRLRVYWLTPNGNQYLGTVKTRK